VELSPSTTFLLVILSYGFVAISVALGPGLITCARIKLRR
jgi:hypothetical protein